MDSKDNKNEDNQQSELSPLEQSDKSLTDDQQTSDISHKRYATTQSVAESLARIRSELGHDQGQQKPSITLNILGIDTPITFHDKVQITLGRKNPGTNEHPDVDLSGLPLNAAGISRKHVNLVYTAGQWFAEDLGSRNGTWLNSKLLMAYQRYKINDGDQLRTGGISIIVLTRADETISDKSKLTSKMMLPSRLILTTSAIIDDQQGLSSVYVTNHLMPYLHSVIEMIQHVDRAKKRPQREISIVSIEFTHPVISISLSCAHEVLQFMRGQPFVMLMSEVEQVLHAKPTTAELSAVRENKSTEMARLFAEEYFPLISADQSLYYQRLLAPLLSACIESDLRVVV